MAEVKYTQKQFYEEVIEAMADNENAVNMARKKLEQLANKNSKSSSKKSEEQEAFMEAIRDVLSEAGDRGMSCKEMLADVRISSFSWKDGNATSSSRLTAYLTKMSEPTEKYPDRLGDIKRVMDKKTPYYSLA